MKKFHALIFVAFLMSTATHAAELVCTSKQGNDQFSINTLTGVVVHGTKRQTVTIVTNASTYAFSGVNWYCLQGGCASKFEVTINRASGLVTTNNGWGFRGGVDEHFTGTCSVSASPKM